MTIAWSEQLTTLLDLQKIDMEFFQLEKKLARHPALKNAIEEQFQKDSEALKAAEKRLQELQLKMKERENDLSTKEQSIAKYESQQMQVKTNKEYSALTTEIKGLKADCSLFEDEILKLLEDTDDQKSRVQKERAALKAEETKMKAEIQALDKEAEDIKDKLKKFTEQRKQYLPLVEKEVLTNYERTLKKRDGTALVSIDGLNCSGCNVKVTHQMVNLIKMKEKPVLCESCARILFDPGD